MYGVLEIFINCMDSAGQCPKQGDTYFQDAEYYFLSSKTANSRHCLLLREAKRL
jgi:hypothetical protein